MYFYKNLIVVFPQGDNASVLFLPPIRAAEIVECVHKYMDEISQNLQSSSPY